MRLYPFQKEMVDKFESVRSVLCGDDMGLGKTVEALALDLRRRTTQLAGKRQTDHKTLIVAPLTMLSAWERHVKAIWPAARVCVVDPKRRDLLAKSLNQPYHYYIVHWEAVRLMEELQTVTWWHIIADEVHRIKNRKSMQTIALKKLDTTYKTGLSGTPADNAPQDLWSVLNWLYSLKWGSFWTFTSYFVKIKQHQANFCMAEGCGKAHKSGFREIVGVENVDELHGAISGYFIRRLKEDVVKDLPDKYYSTIEVELAPRQRRIYEQMKQDMLAWIGKHEEEPVAAPVIIAQLTRLKQFALAYAELKTVKRIHNGVEQEIQVVRLSEPSSKLDAAMEKIAETDQPIVVFSESKQIIGLLVERLKKAKISYVTLTGDTPQSERGELIDKFQNGEARVFAGTIGAGGIGITLTAASTVIFLDRAWNPSVNKQAEDRLHRIGQNNAVHVIDIVATDTVDRGRLQRLKLKWSWLRQLLGDKVEEEVLIDA
jgi:SNF2 family DNA or RNA helicase